MAKKEMLQSTCDKCGKTHLQELDRWKRKQAVLPDGWAHMSLTTNKDEIAAMDLCDDCLKPVLESAGKYKRGV